MVSMALSSSSSSYPWQLISKSHTTFTLSSFSTSFISLSSISSSSSTSTKNSNASRRYVYLCKYSANDDNREKALVVSQPIKSHEFGGLFHKRSLWRRISFTSKKVRAIILLNAITIICASDIPVLKEVEKFTDPATFNVVRFSISAIPFLPAAFRARNDAHICKSGAELGLWASLGYVLQSIGLITSDVGRASFISILTVIVVPLLDGMFGSVIPPLTWFGAVMSVVGVAMLESSGSPPDVGDLFNFLSAVFFGVHMLRTERISRITSKENFIPLLGYEVCVVALSSIIWFFFESWFGESHRHWTWDLFWASLVSFPLIPAIYTGVLTTGLCLWVEMAAMRDVSATETAIIYGTEPVWGAGFAWFLLGERWDTVGWIGAALILGASLLVHMFGSLTSSDSGSGEG